jgi:hypothetical protein
LSLNAFRIRSTSSSRWNAEASRERSLSSSAKSCSGFVSGFEDDPELVEAIWCRCRCRCASGGWGKREVWLPYALAPGSMSFSRSLPSLRLACHSSPFACRNSQLNWHGSVLKSRNFYSTPGLRNAGNTPPPKPLPRLASRKDVYAARNKTLFMYTSAVVSIYRWHTYNYNHD